MDSDEFTTEWMINDIMSGLTTGTIFFGFAHTPDGTPFVATPDAEGIYVITDAQNTGSGAGSPDALGRG